MAGFNVAVRMNLTGPDNLRQTVSKIQRELSGIRSTATFDLDKSSLTTLKNIRKEANITSDSIANFGKQAGLAAKRFVAFTVSAGSIIAFLGAVRSAVGEAVKFQHELVRLSQVGEDTSKEIRGIENEVTRLSTTFGVASSDLIKAATTLRQAGLSADATKTSLQALALAALAPNFDNMTKTAEGAVAIMSQFKIGADQLEGALGSVNAVAAGFAVEAGDIIEAVKRAGGAFSAAGGSLNEFIALFTSVRATTRESAETISTGLRTIFTRIQRPEVLDNLEKLNIRLRHTKEEANSLGNSKLADQFVGGYEAVKRLSAALSELQTTDTRFAALAEELGGYRQISKIIPLIKEFGLAQDALNVAQKGSTSLQGSAAKAQDSLIIRLGKLKEEFFALFRTVTESKSFNNFIDIVLKGASALIKLTEALSPLIPLLATLGAMKFLSNIGGLFGGFSQGLGTSAPIDRARGIPRFAKGGVVPGSGNKDSVLGMLTPGEVVIPKKYADGGIVVITDQVGQSGPLTLNKGKSKKYPPAQIVGPNVAVKENLDSVVSSRMRDIISEFLTGSGVSESGKKIDLNKYGLASIKGNIYEAALASISGLDKDKVSNSAPFDLVRPPKEAFQKLVSLPGNFDYGEVKTGKAAQSGLAAAIRKKYDDLKRQEQEQKDKAQNKHLGGRIGLGIGGTGTVAKGFGSVRKLPDVLKEVSTNRDLSSNDIIAMLKEAGGDEQKFLQLRDIERTKRNRGVSPTIFNEATGKPLTALQNFSGGVDDQTYLKLLANISVERQGISTPAVPLNANTKGFAATRLKTALARNSFIGSMITESVLDKILSNVSVGADVTNVGEFPGKRTSVFLKNLEGTEFSRITTAVGSKSFPLPDSVKTGRIIGLGNGLVMEKFGSVGRLLSGKGDISGNFQGFANGGIVPGRGNSDTVPADLPDGSFVIRKSSVQKFGADRLQRLAQGGDVKALLTPGEFVFDPNSAKRIGGAKLDSINRRGFAGGGRVGMALGGNGNFTDLAPVIESLRSQLALLSTSVSDANKNIRSDSLLGAANAKVSSAQSSVDFATQKVALNNADRKSTSGKIDDLKSARKSATDPKLIAGIDAELSKQLGVLAIVNQQAGVYSQRLIIANDKLQDEIKERDSLLTSLNQAHNVDALLEQKKKLNAALLDTENKQKEQSAASEKARQATLDSITKRGATPEEAAAAKEIYKRSRKEAQLTKREEDESKKIFSIKRLAAQQVKDNLGENLSAPGALSKSTKKSLAESRIPIIQEEFVQSQSRVIRLLNKSLTAEEARIIATEQFTQEVKKGKAKVQLDAAGKIIGTEKALSQLGSNAPTKAATGGKLERFGDFLERRKERGVGGNIKDAGVATKNFVESRASTIGNSALFALPVIIDQLTKGSPQIEKGQTEENLKKATRIEGLTGLTTGASIGGLLAGPVGAISGGLLGYLSAIEDAENKVRKVKLDEAIDKFSGKLSDLANKVGDISQGDLSDLSTDISKLNKGITAKVAEESTSFGSRFLSAATRGTFGRSAENLDFRKIFESQAKEQTDLAKQQTPALTNVLNKFAKTTGKNTNDKELLGSIESFKNANKDIIQTIARGRGTSTEKVEKEFDKIIRESLKAQKEEGKQKEGLAAQARTIAGFNALTLAVKDATDAFQEFDNSSQTISDLFSGTSGVSKFTGVSGKVGEFGGSRPQVFASAVDSITSPLGEAGKGVNKTAKDFDKAARALPNILTNLAGKQFGTDGDVGGQLAEALKAQGVGDDIVTIIRGRFANLKPEDLVEGVGRNVDELSKTLLQDSKGVQDALINIGKELDSAGAKLLEGFTKNEQFVKQLGQIRDRTLSLELDTEKAKARQLAEGIGQPAKAIDFVSLDAALKPFKDRLSRLTGLQGGQAQNPAAIGKELTATIVKIRQGEAGLNKLTPGTDKFRDAGEALAKLKGKADNLQEALKDLSDASKQNAEIQERINNLQSDRESRTSFTERFLRGDRETKQNLGQGAGLARVAAQQGIGNFDPASINKLFDFLDSLGDTKLLGVQGTPTAKDFKKILIESSPVGKLFGNQQGKNDIAALRQKEVDNLATAAKANAELGKVLQESQNKFITDLKATHATINTKLEENIKAQVDLMKSIEKGQVVGELSRENAKKSKIDKLAEFGIGEKDFTNIRGKEVKIEQLAELTRTNDRIAKSIENVKKNPIVLDNNNLAGDLVNKFGFTQDEAIKGAGLIGDSRGRVNRKEITREQHNNEALSIVEKLLQDRQKEQKKLQDELKISPEIIKNFDKFKDAMTGLQQADFGSINKNLEDLGKRLKELEGNIPKPAPVELATGGTVPVVSGGMRHPLAKGTDTVPAMLSPGEFVVNRQATSRNLGLLRSLNGGGQGGGGYFAKGGIIGDFRPVPSELPFLDMIYPSEDIGKIREGKDYTTLDRTKDASDLLDILVDVNQKKKKAINDSLYYKKVKDSYFYDKSFLKSAAVNDTFALIAGRVNGDLGQFKYDTKTLQISKNSVFNNLGLTKNDHNEEVAKNRDNLLKDVVRLSKKHQETADNKQNLFDQFEQVNNNQKVFPFDTSATVSGDITKQLKERYSVQNIADLSFKQLNEALSSMVPEENSLSTRSVWAGDLISTHRNKLRAIAKEIQTSPQYLAGQKNNAPKPPVVEQPKQDGQNEPQPLPPAAPQGQFQDKDVAQGLADFTALTQAEQAKNLVTQFPLVNQKGVPQQVKDIFEQKKQIYKQILLGPYQDLTPEVRVGDQNEDVSARIGALRLLSIQRANARNNSGFFGARDAAVQNLPNNNILKFFVETDKEFENLANNFIQLDNATKIQGLNNDPKLVQAEINKELQLGKAFLEGRNKLLGGGKQKPVKKKFQAEQLQGQNRLGNLGVPGVGEGEHAQPQPVQNPDFEAFKQRQAEEEERKRRANGEKPGLFEGDGPGLKLARGGFVNNARFLSNGGGIGTDTVPAMLTPGEYVVRASQAQKPVNAAILNAMNNGQQIQHKARGGRVSYLSDGSSSAAGGFNVDFNKMAEGAHVFNMAVASFNTYSAKLSKALESFMPKIELQVGGRIEVNITGVGQYAQVIGQDMEKALTKQVAKVVLAKVVKGNPDVFNGGVEGSLDA